MFSFRWNRPIFFGWFVRKSSKQFHTIQNDEDHVSKIIKSCFFLSIRSRKTSQTQDVKCKSTKGSLWSLAQPKGDSAFEQKVRIVPSREISGRSQNIFCSYSQKRSKAELKIPFWNVLNVVLEFWCFPFGEIAHYFSDGLYENHQNNCTQSKTTKTTFPKKSKAVFF